MATNNFHISQVIEDNSNIQDEEYTIPLCIDDILTICKEYAKLGHNIQSQIDNIIECGVDEAIKSGMVKRENLIYIKDFLKKIGENPYFGDSIDQSKDVLNAIYLYEEKNKSTFLKSSLVLN